MTIYPKEKAGLSPFLSILHIDTPSYIKYNLYYMLYFLYF